MGEVGNIQLSERGDVVRERGETNPINGQVNMGNAGLVERDYNELVRVLMEGQKSKRKVFLVYECWLTNIKY